MNSGKRLTNDEALERINEKCKEKNVEFIGFKNDENIYKNDKVYLILKCKKCGRIWETTSYQKFVRSNHSCPNCSPTKKISKEEMITSIKKICKEKDFTFLGFTEEFNGVYSKLHLKCNKCGSEWKSTTYNNLRKKDRKTHTCGRNNPLHMPSILNEKKAIENINKQLENTSLEFTSFDENGYTGRKNSHVLLRCKKCNHISKYSYRICISSLVKCRKCEYNGKIPHEKALANVIEKCNLLDYTFLGFNTEDGKYDGKNSKLKLRCNKCGYIWETTTYNTFMHSIIKCVECKNVWKMEKEIEIMLKRNSIKYIHDCRNKILPWLKYKASLSLDFYLPEYNIGIECQGRSHFEPVLDFGSKKSFMKSLERDKKKLILCKENGIKLLYYDSELGHTEFLGEKVYNDAQIMNEIKNKITSYEQKN